MKNKGLIIRNKRGQVWIETVIYTLIAFAMIGAVLAFVKPKIQEAQDKAIIQQSISVMEEMDNIITDVAIAGEGNKRKIPLTIKKGSIKIDGSTEKIIFEMESRYEYSEIEQNTNIGNIVARTDKKAGKLYTVTLTLNYFEKYNLAFGGNAIESKTITKSSTPYNLYVSNKKIDGNSAINFELG